MLSVPHTHVEKNSHTKIAWVQWKDGVVGKIKGNTYYNVTPDGLLIQRKGEQQRN